MRSIYIHVTSFKSVKIRIDGKKITSLKETLQFQSKWIRRKEILFEFEINIHMKQVREKFVVMKLFKL